MGELDAGPSTGLVVPGPKRRAGFHRREDVDQSRLRAPASQHFGHAVFLAEVLPLDELDLQPRLSGQLHGVIPQRVAQRFGENAHVKATNPSEVQLSFQRRRMTHVQQTARDDDAVKATQLTHNL